MSESTGPSSTEMSISNPYPELIDGPALLHELITGPDCSVPSVEHLDADGTRTIISYKDLHGKANRIASRLQNYQKDRSNGLPTIIPILVPQCSLLYVSLLGILKSGAAFCPLNLDLPEERLRFIIQDVSAEVIITTTHLHPRLAEVTNIPILVADEDGDDDNEDPPAGPPTSTENLAYIMYTSGSTGLPKAVCISHRAATQALLAHDEHVPVFFRFLQFASPTFDVSVFEIFFPWFRGSTLVSCDRNRLLSNLTDTICEMDVDAAELTPSVAATLVRRREAVPSLKVLLTIGEMLSTQVIQEFGGSDARPSLLYGMYGPTEATIHCTIQPALSSDVSINNIGRPLDTVSCYIAKPSNSQNLETLELLPIGEKGELVVGGHQIADGYLNREEQTRKAFFHHPDYGRLYRTGDKARMLPDGHFECFGRISSGQVKLRGQRIELGEVQHAASKVGGCQASMASVIDGTLVLFCILDPTEADVAMIRLSCQKWLPRFMVPSEIVSLAEFPHLPSGKVDRKALEASYVADNRAANSQDHEHMPAQLRAIYSILGNVLGPRLGKKASLAAAGMDSLKAIQVSAEIRKHQLTAVSAIDILEADSAEDIHNLMSSAAHKASDDDSTADTDQIFDEIKTMALKQPDIASYTSDVADIFPCTSLQDAMLYETSRDAKAYCNSMTLRINRSLPTTEILQALQRLADCHPSLRSGFFIAPNAASNNVQVVWNALAADQLKIADSDDDASATNQLDDLLRPFRVQLRSSAEGTDLDILIHHALYDQWSVDILVHDLTTLLNGQPLTQRPSMRTVSHYLSTQKASQSASTARDFWQDYLYNAQPAQLPNLTGKTDLKRSLTVSSLHIDLDMGALRSVSSTYGCSTHVIFQAAYASLLSSYTGSQDYIFGNVFSGRTIPIAHVEELVGPLLTTLPMRIDISKAKRFSDLMNVLQSANRDIMRHSIVSLAEIKRNCNMPPQVALFDCIFVWQETVHPRPSDRLVEVEDCRDYLEFNFTLDLEPVSNGVRAKATYQTSLLPKQQMNMFLKQLCEIVKSVIARPDCYLDSIHQAMAPSLQSIANPEPDLLEFKSSPASFVEQLAWSRPDSPALLFVKSIDGLTIDSKSVTYSQLNQRANALAHLLIERGIQPDELVCVMMEKSPDLYVSILASMKAGAGYLPLTSETPIERVKKIVGEARLRTCLTDTNTFNLGQAAGFADPVDVQTVDLTGQLISNPEVQISPSNLAYAIYTSGTTGQPKGVLVTMENLLSNIAVLKEIYPVQDNDRLLQACSQAFDVSVFEIFFAWATGMCLCSATKDVLLRDLGNAIRVMGVTHLSFTPTVAALVRPESVPTVRFLVTAGEAVTNQVHRTWSGKGLFQGYGPSETTNICTVNPSVSADDAINNIGPAFRNTSTFVLAPSKKFHPVPAGGLGELCFGGQQVFRGYQNMPDLAQSKIINHPRYGRIYRSGDLGRLLHNGTILIEGRIDSQRKLRGQRIELGEIAANLLISEMVQDCSIQILGSAKGEERLVAFWVLAKQHQQVHSVHPPTQQVKQAVGRLFSTLEENMPSYMVPSTLVPTTNLPMTSQGKIDVRTLGRDFDGLSTDQLDCFSRQSSEEEADQDFTDTELQLVPILAKTFDIKSSLIGRSRSFFALGLDSLSAVRLSRAVKEALGKQIDVSTILKNPSVSRLGRHLDHLTHADPRTSQVEKRSKLLSTDTISAIHDKFESSASRIANVLPCTPLQEAMLSASLEGTSGAYCNKMVFQVHGDIALLKKAFNRMIERHEILRTVFCSTEDPQSPFVQVVLDAHNLPWYESADESPSVTSPLDTQRPPYAILFRRQDSKPFIELEMHHALYDANAMSALLREIETVYKGETLGPVPSLEQFLRYIATTDYGPADVFFDESLKNYNPKHLPRAASSEDQSPSDSGQRSIHKVLSVSRHGIENYLQGQSVQLLAVCQAAWAKVLALVQASSDVCFGNVVSGRDIDIDGIDDLVAPCFNTIPVRANLAKVKTNIGLIRQIQQYIFDVHSYQHTPLRRIQQRLCVNGRLFDSLVLLQQQLRPLDSEIWSLEEESGDMTFPCIIEITPRNDDIDVLLHFEHSVFDSEAAASAILDAFIGAFTACLRYPLSDTDEFDEYDTTLIKGMTANTERTSAKDSDIEEMGTHEEDWTETELIIRDTYAELSKLSRDDITRDTSIYRMGLDSISAIQVANRLRKRGYNFSVGDVLEHPSCSALASIVHGRSSSPEPRRPQFDFTAFDSRHRQAVIETYDVSSDDIEAIRPCTPLQAGMLSHYLRSHGIQYFNHIFYEIPDRVDVDLVRDAWAQVADAHQILRTGFVELDDVKDQFAMVVYRSSRMKVCQLPNGKNVPPFEVLQREAADSVYATLHRPTWRVAYCGQIRSRMMQISIHHALYDAESLRRMLSDLQTVLQGQVLTPSASIDAAADHIIHAKANCDEALKAFWVNHLEGASLARFPNLNSVIPETSGIATCERTCRATQNQIEQACSKSEISIQAVGQATWAKILAAYTGESAVTFGVVYSGRASPETTDAVFPCINTLPLRCNTDQDDLALTRDLMSFNATVLKNPFLPLTELKRYAGLKEELLSDTIFAYQKTTGQSSGTLPWKIVHEHASVDSPVSMELESSDDGVVQLRLTFDTAVLPMEQGEILLQQYEEIFMRILHGREASSVDSFPDPAIMSYLTPKEAAIPTEMTLLHHFVERSARICPETIALEFVDALEDGVVRSRTWTYEQLNTTANQVAHFIQGLGAKAGDIISISLDRCPEASIAFLAILKAGCAFLAIDYSAPAARKRFILEDSQCKILLTDSLVAEELVEIEHTGVLDFLNTKYDQLPVSPLTVDGLSSSMNTYVLYTSGTTGTPKGCEITHHNMVQVIMAFQRLFNGRWTPESRWLQFASYHFDVAVIEHFWSWSVGIRVVGAPRDLILEDIPGFVNALQITHLDLTPSLGRLLDPQSVPSLHSGVFITGGEAVKQDTIQKWGDVGCLFNFYGPTECTIGVTTFPSVPKHGNASNIGWRFDNVGAIVLRPGTNSPVMRGAVGELCIFGCLVGKGYLNRPELNAERFPMLDATNERIYRTGDLVRVLHDDSFEFLGRADSQVKLRGQRLEIDEIDAVIRRSPDIKDVASLVIKSTSQGNEQLVSFIAVESERTQESSQLLSVADSVHLCQAGRSLCEENLPGYMVPSHFIPVHAMPLSINNKLDEKALRTIFQTFRSDQLQQYAATPDSARPLNTTEKAICRALLATLPEVDETSLRPDSNIFSLGLSSISAIQLTRRLKDQGFHRPAVATIMQNATIGRLATALNRGNRRESGSVTIAKQMINACYFKHLRTATEILSCSPDDIVAIAPCTPLQQGIIARSFNSVDALYFNTFRYKADNLDPDRLRNAFELLIRETQMLRTGFVETEDGHVQAVQRSKELPWLDIDDGTLHQHRRDWTAMNIPHLTRPFEALLSRTGDSTSLCINIHHAIYDGQAYDLLIQRLSNIYEDQNENTDRPSSVTFLDALPHGPLLQVAGAQAFWTKHMEGAHFQQMQTIDSASPKDILVSTTIRGASEFEMIRKRLGVTLQAILQVAWVTTLRKYHQGPVGMVVSGRSIDLDGAETIIGPLFNTIPFAPLVRKGESWKGLIKQCHEFNTVALSFQHTSLRDIARWCERSPTKSLFETLFVYQQSRSQRPGLLEPINDDTFHADYALAFEVEQSEDGFEVTLAAERRICTERQAEQILHEFNTNLSLLTSDANARIPEACTTASDSSVSIAEVSNDADVNGVEDFAWTEQARIVQDEIASLISTEHSEVDEHISIFSLGLDSIDVVKLSARLRNRGLSIPVSAIMKAQTIPRILAASSNASHSSDAQDSSKLLSAMEKRLTVALSQQGFDMNVVERVLPASPMQEALVAEMRRTEYKEYFNHDVLQLDKDVDLDRLTAAWHTVIKRTPILRTAFVSIQDPSSEVTFAQVVLKERTIAVEQRDIENNQSFSHYMDAIKDEVSAEEDLSVPFRLTVFCTPSNQYLVLSMAHALYDGFSLGLLHKDIRDAYHGQVSERSAYVNVLGTALQATGLQAKEFWRSLLIGASRTEILDTMQTGGKDTIRASTISTLDAETIAAFCRTHGITVQALCQTVWALVLSRYVQTLDVLFGVVLNGRNTADSEEIIFPTMNTVVMRSVIHGSRQEMLRNMQKTLADVMAYQQTPLQVIQGVAPRDHRAAALFDTLFIFQKRPASIDAGERQLYESVESSADVGYPVAVEAELLDGQLVWRTACKTSVFNAAGTEDLLAELEWVLQRIIDEPSAAVINVGDDGISVCGLPAFEQRHRGSPKSDTDHQGQLDDHQDDVWSDTEESVRHIISQMARIPENEIRKHSSLRNLGIDSINAIKVVSLLKSKSMRISVSQLLGSGTIAAISTAIQLPSQARIHSRSPDEGISAFNERMGLTSKSLGFTPVDIESILPATAGQVYTLSAWLNSQGQLMYADFSYEIQPAIDLEKLQLAWTAVVERHSTLRTVFCATSSAQVPFAQLVLREAPAVVTDVSNMDDAHISSMEQPLVRLSATREDSATKVNLHVHHALYDAISLPLLIQDLEALLNGNQIPQSQMSLADITAPTLDGASNQKRRDFWRDYLRDIDVINFSIDEHESQRRVETYNPTAFPVADYQSRTRQMGLSLQSLFFAAYAKVYARLSPSPPVAGISVRQGGDVVIGIYMANRSHADDLSNLAAPTLNLLPLAVRKAATTDLLTLATRIQEDLRRMGESDISSTALWEIQEWTGVKVATFVNFVHLPDRDESQESQRGDVLGGPSGHNIKEVDTGYRVKAYSRVHGPDLDEAFTVPKYLENATHLEAYPPSLDIEAIVTKSGDLGIGAFGWEGMISLAQAEKIIEDLTTELRDALS